MKKIFLTLTTLVVSFMAIAQSPNLFNYQGVARNAVGNVLPNQPIGLRLSILTGSPTGAAVYTETRNVPTNAFGLFNVQVGSPGAITSTGTIAGINWTAFGTGSGTKYLKVEIDPIGGTNYVNAGTTQLVSVPYAINAAAAAPVGPAGGDLSGTYPNPTVVRLQGRNVSATAPVNQNLLMWDAATTSWIPATAAQAGVVSGSGTLNYVPKWTPNGTTIGNSQIFDNGTNVGVGTATPAYKLSIVAGDNDGISINNSGTNFANAAIQLTNTTTSPARTNNAIIALKSGTTDRALQFFNASVGMTATDISYNFLNNAAAPIVSILNNGNAGIGSSNPASKLTVDGTGSSQTISPTWIPFSPANYTRNNLAAGDNKTGVLGFADGSTGAGRNNGLVGIGEGSAFVNTGVTALSGANASGNFSIGILAQTTGTGANAYAGYFIGRMAIIDGTEGLNRVLRSDAAGNASWSTLAALGAVTGSGTTNFLPKWTPNGTTLGNSMVFDNGTSVGIGTTTPAGTLNVINSNATSTAAAGTAVFAQKGPFLNQFGNPTTILSTGTANNAIAFAGLADVGFGVVGGTVGAGIGVLGQTFGPAGGIGLWGIGSNPTAYALVTNGRVQIQGQGAAAGSVLTSDAAGNATWQPAAGGGGANVGIGLRELSSLTVPDNTLVPVTQWLNIVHENGGANYNPSTGEYTITVAGVYQINAAIAFLPTANGFITLQTYVNNNFDNENPMGTTANRYLTPSVSYLRNLAVGDRVSVSVYQSTGATQNAIGTFYANNFSLQLIR